MIRKNGKQLTLELLLGIDSSQILPTMLRLPVNRYGKLSMCLYRYQVPEPNVKPWLDRGDRFGVFFRENCFRGCPFTGVLHTGAKPSSENSKRVIGLTLIVIVSRLVHPLTNFRLLNRIETA